MSDDNQHDLSAREPGIRKWSDVRRSKGQDTAIAARAAALAELEADYQRLAYQVVDAARRWFRQRGRGMVMEEDLTTAIRELIDFENRIGYTAPLDTFTE